jgi:SPP1 family predicted phage head-tail adaptor
MKAGALRHLVTLQAPLVTTNDYGEAITTWQDVATLSAALVPLSAREFFHAQQTQADVTHKVMLRYRPGLTPTMRLVVCGRIFHIASVIDREERQVELELLCKETL